MDKLRRKRHSPSGLLEAFRAYFNLGWLCLLIMAFLVAREKVFHKLLNKLLWEDLVYVVKYYVTNISGQTIYMESNKRMHI